MDQVIDFITYLIGAISDYDTLPGYQMEYREINLLPNIYIGIYIIRKKKGD